MSGTLWWLRWMLPSSRRKLGNGWALPQRGSDGGALAGPGPHFHHGYAAHSGAGMA